MTFARGDAVYYGMALCGSNSFRCTVMCDGSENHCRVRIDRVLSTGYESWEAGNEFVCWSGHLKLVPPLEELAEQAE